MKKSELQQMAQQTVICVQQGYYTLEDQTRISLQDLVEDCCEQTKWFRPNQLEKLKWQALGETGQDRPTAYTVANETTLQGVTELLKVVDSEKVGVLNFASARSPGGGFLNGAQAQEESLARCSALYASLIKCMDFYDLHRQLKSCLYTHSMILSPDCPIFRDDTGKYLPSPQLVHFITAAAPNAGAIASNEPEDTSKIPQALHERAEYVLALALSHGIQNLVLGAWGCGVFRNDPERVADTFADLLLRGAWKDRFRNIRFSVWDRGEALGNYAPFADAFGG